MEVESIAVGEEVEVEVVVQMCFVRKTRDWEQVSMIFVGVCLSVWIVVVVMGELEVGDWVTYLRINLVRSVARKVR